MVLLSSKTNLFIKRISLSVESMPQEHRYVYCTIPLQILIFRRFMWRSYAPRTTQLYHHVSRVNSTSYLRNTSHHVPSTHFRSYPGDNLPVFYKKPMVPYSNTKEIPEAEKSHLKILKDGYIIGVLTSSPRNKDTGELYHFVSKEKYNGTITPLLNQNGTQNDEGQYIAFFKEPRLVTDPSLIGIDITKQAYFDSNEDVINMLYKIHGPVNPHIRARISKDDPILFDENGHRDKDNF